MGIESMRRWPTYIVFAICVLLFLSLFNNWSVEIELRNRISELNTQLQESSKQQTSCMEESLTLLEQRDGYVVKLNELNKQKTKVAEDLTDYKQRLTKSEIQINNTRVDVEICKSELQSLKNLQVSKTAMLETLRIDKDTLTTQLGERKQKIEDLEKEIENLKNALAAKSIVKPSTSSKVTPVVQPPQMSPVLNANIPLNEAENDAKEELEDVNAINDGNDFDTQLQ